MCVKESERVVRRVVSEHTNLSHHSSPITVSRDTGEGNRKYDLVDTLTYF